MKEIQEYLFEVRDKEYAAFHAKLVPTMASDKVIGVRTPLLRKYAKEICKMDCKEAFLGELPHDYFEENQLHAFIISEEKDYEKCLEELETFLPYIDNWATCDQLSPKVFKKHIEELEVQAYQWMASTETYIIRFGIGVLMQHFLDDQFRVEQAERIAAIRSEEYYVNMMVAWYFATALAKQYDQILPFIEERRMERWTHNKAIQKAIESYRIAPEQKDYLRTLKIKK